MPYDVVGAEKMKDMPLGCVLGSLFFFLNLGIELSKDTIHSFQKQQENKDIQGQIFSAKNGDGTVPSTHLLMEMLQDLKISLN